jgi:hypothetical protein
MHRRQRLPSQLPTHLAALRRDHHLVQVPGAAAAAAVVADGQLLQRPHVPQHEAEVVHLSALEGLGPGQQLVVPAAGAGCAGQLH